MYHSWWSSSSSGLQSSPAATSIHLHCLVQHTGSAYGTRGVLKTARSSIPRRLAPSAFLPRQHPLQPYRLPQPPQSVYAKQGSMRDFILLVQCRKKWSSSMSREGHAHFSLLAPHLSLGVHTRPTTPGAASVMGACGLANFDAQETRSVVA